VLAGYWPWAVELIMKPKYSNRANLTQRAREAAQEIGVVLNDSIPYGRSRHPGAGKAPSNKSCAVLRIDDKVMVYDHSTKLSAAVFQNERSQIRRGKKTQQPAINQQQALSEKKRREQAIIDCRKVWATAPPAANHPYLLRKQIEPHISRQDRKTGALLVPVIDVSGKLQSVQRIFPNGSKWCWPGASVKAGFAPLGILSEAPKFLIAEGFATSATLREQTNYPVAAAMFAGNLKAVAMVLRLKCPRADIVICGDDDRFTEGNPGKTAAIEAARAIGAKWAVPPFPENSIGTDFNDYHLLNSRGEA